MKIAILQELPGWSTKLATILDALKRGKLQHLTVYVEDESMQKLVLAACTDNQVESKVTCMLLMDAPRNQILTDNWRLGIHWSED